MHGLRGEAGMSDKEEPEHYSIEDVEKCQKNAIRLYKDALNTSIPTKAALIELGIEELSKGIILLANIPKPNLDPVLKELINLNSDSDLLSSLDSLKKYNFKKFDMFDHKRKLKIIEDIFKSLGLVYPQSERITAALLNIMRPTFGTVDDKQTAKFDDVISDINRFNFRDLYKIKENGFYVNFIGNKVVSPMEQDLKTEEITGIFSVLYIPLNILVEIYKGTQFTSIFSDAKLILGDLYDLLSEVSKNNLGREER